MVDYSRDEPAHNFANAIAIVRRAWAGNCYFLVRMTFQTCLPNLACRRHTPWGAGLDCCLGGGSAIFSPRRPRSRSRVRSHRRSNDPQGMIRDTTIGLIQQEPLTVGSDCSGVDAVMLALDRLCVPTTHVFSSEKDKVARRVLLANFRSVND